MIVTFYSYKGGVGRSMAMANVADLLARSGRRILIVDFDLEAPGLEQYFAINQAAARRHPGLMDLLLAYKRAMSVARPESAAQDDFRQLGRFIVPIYESLPGGGRLDLLPAGQREGREQLDRYAASVRSFDWQDFYFNWEGELFFEWLRKTLHEQAYEIVLVDSRTGVTEMGGICTYQLADAVVMLCAANHQNRQGTRSVALDFESPPVQVARRDRPLQILVVPARVEQRHPELFDEFLAVFEQEFGRYLPAALRQKGVTFRDLVIPYEPRYAFEERVLSDPAQGAGRREIASAFERLAEAVLMLTPGAEGAEGQPAAADAAPVGGLDAAAAAQFDATKRFSGYDVFLSHALEDSGEAKALAEDLRGLGLEVFLDCREATAGEDWRARTEHALFHSKACLVGYGATAADSRIGDLLAAIRSVESGHLLRVVLLLWPGADERRLRAALPPEIAAWQSLDLRAGRPDPGYRARLVELAQSIAPPEVATPATVATYGEPYRGLDPFTEKDAPLFFGREETAAGLADLIEKLPITALTGPSGAGKTSIVQAGIVPELRRRATGAGRQGWLFQRCTPADGREALDTAIESLSLRALAGSAGEDGRRKLLFVDDVEQLLHLQGDAGQQFVRRLLDAAGRIPGLRILLAAREDSMLPLSATFPGLIPDPPALTRLPPLQGAELRRVLETAAQKAGLAFEPGLLDRLLADWGGDQRYLGLLQSVLRDLWAQRREGFLTNRAYEAIPDPVEALAEAAFASMTEAEQAAARRVVPRLLQLSGEVEPMTACPRGELRLGDINPDVLDSMLERLVDRRIVSATTDDRGQPIVAPAFTSVQWPRAQQWAEADAKFLEWLGRLHHYRADWSRNDRDQGALLAGVLLREASEWLERRAPDLNAAEREYIRGSQNAARARRRERVLAAALVALLILGSGLFAWRTSNAQEQATRQEARVDGLLAEAAAAYAGNDLATAEARYSDVLAIVPDHPVARLRRGDLYDAQGKYDQAIADYSTVITPTPTADPLVESQKADAYLSRGVARLHSKDLTGALQDLTAAVRISPTDPVPLVTRGVVFEARQQKDEALRDYTQALKVRPDFPEALFRRGTLYQSLGRRAEAMRDLNRVIVVDAEAQMKQAASARLAELGALVSRVQQSRTVHLYNSDPDDAPVMDQVARALEDGEFLVKRVDKVSTQPSSAVVRYFFKEDAAAADTVRRLTESALARLGHNVRLQTYYVPLDVDRQGEIHCRIPSLKLGGISDYRRQAASKE